MTTAAATTLTSPTAPGGRVIAALGHVARGVGARAVSAARKGGASATGAAGLASIAVGAGMVYLPAGFIVGGALAVWFASLLPGGDRS